MDLSCNGTFFTKTTCLYASALSVYSRWIWVHRQKWTPRQRILSKYCVLAKNSPVWFCWKIETSKVNVICRGISIQLNGASFSQDARLEMWNQSSFSSAISLTQRQVIVLLCIKQGGSPVLKMLIMKLSPSSRGMEILWHGGWYLNIKAYYDHAVILGQDLDWCPVKHKHAIGPRLLI